MKPVTAEWFAKAEGDYHSMEREVRARKDPNLDGACFHAQQCEEKYLKARLMEGGLAFGKIHDLPALLSQTLAVEPGWTIFMTDLAFLSEFAVSYRYPGDDADRAAARDARKRCRTFRLAARAAMGLRP